MDRRMELMDRQTDEDRWMKSDDQTDGDGQTDTDRRYWTDRKDGNSRQTDGQSLKYIQQTRDRKTHGQGQKEPGRDKDRAGVGAV